MIFNNYQLISRTQMSHCNTAMFKESKFKGTIIQKKLKKKRARKTHKFAPRTEIY